MMESDEFSRYSLKAMFHKSMIPIYLLLALLFVGLGDKFLPQPLSGMSYNTRTTLNQWMTGSFQVWQPKTKPHERTQEEIQRQEKNK